MSSLATPSRTTPSHDQTLRDSVQRWLDSYTNPNTKEAYQHRIDDFLSYLSGDLSVEVIQAYSQNVRNRINEGTITANTGRAYLFALACFLKWGHVFDLWPDLTPEKINHLVDIPGRDDSIQAKEILSREEVNQLVQEAETVRDRAMIYLLAGSGVRVSELVDLTPADIYSTENESGEKHYLEVSKAKGDKTRTVQISRPVYQAVSEYLMEQGRNIHQDDHKPIFQGREGGLSTKSVNRTVKQLSKASGLGRDISAHNLRHTYATRKLIQGVPLRIVSKRLGHESLDTTEEFYIGVIGDLEEEPEECWFTG
jgi:site-specific recombinase XerD